MSNSFDGNDVRLEDDYSFRDDSKYEFGDERNNDIIDRDRSASYVQWLMEAAEQGDVDAQLPIARMYEEGQGVAQSDSKAQRLYLEAALQSSEAAQSRIEGHRASILQSKDAAQWAPEELGDFNDENGGVDDYTISFYDEYSDDDDEASQ